MLAVIIVISILLTFMSMLFFISPGLLGVKKVDGGFGGTHFRLVDPAENILFFLKEDMRNAIHEIIQTPVLTITTVEEIPESIPYRRSTTFVSRAVHIGQLKLFLTEMQFLTDVLLKHDEEAYVVYAGSAPGNKMGILHDMFPKVKFIFIDPHDHLIMYRDKNHYDMPYRNEVAYLRASSTNMWKVRNPQIINMWDGTSVKQQRKQGSNSTKFDKMVENHDETIAKFIKDSKYFYYIIEGFYTTNLSHCLKTLKEDKPVYFISDIRSRVEEDDFPSDMDIVWNSSIQMEWLDVLRPTKAMLKFHPPYFEKEHKEEFKRLMKQSPYADSFKNTKTRVDYANDYLNGKFRYYAAEKINLQAFAGLTSSEGRIIISDFDKITDHNPKEYEDKLFYYNRLMRDIGYHDDHQDMWDKELGIDACGDCALMCQLFRQYFMKFQNKSSADAGKSGLHAIKKLMTDIRRTFFVKGASHGYFYKQYELFEDVLKNQNELLMIQYVSKNLKELLRSYRKQLSLNDTTQRASLIKKLKEVADSHSVDSETYYNDLILSDLYYDNHEKIRFLSIPKWEDYKKLITKSETSNSNLVVNQDLNNVIMTIGPHKIKISKCKHDLWKKYATDEQIAMNYLWFYQISYKQLMNIKAEPICDMINNVVKEYKIKNVYEWCDGLVYSTLINGKINCNVEIKTLYPSLTEHKIFTGHFFDSEPEEDSLIFLRISNDSSLLLFTIVEYLMYLYKKKNVKAIIITHRPKNIYYFTKNITSKPIETIPSYDLECNEKLIKMYISVIGLSLEVVT